MVLVEVCTNHIKSPVTAVRVALKSWIVNPYWGIVINPLYTSDLYTHKRGLPIGDGWPNTMFWPWFTCFFGGQVYHTPWNLPVVSQWNIPIVSGFEFWPWYIDTVGWRKPPCRGRLLCQRAMQALEICLKFIKMASSGKKSRSSWWSSWWVSWFPGSSWIKNWSNPKGAKSPWDV